MATLQSSSSTPSSSMTSDSDLGNTMVEPTTLNSPVEMIETVIDSLDTDNTAMVNKGEGGHLWKFKYGTVEVFVQLTGLTDEDTLMVWASVLKLPAKNEPELMKKLLEMNWLGTLEARFGIFNGGIVVLTSRILADLSPGEVSRAITIVATLADEQDELLQAQYGA